jgi:predicted phosphodiesterase
MRYGVLSDVHGNLHALLAAIDVLERARVERYLCLGDLVGYGAFPNECAQRVAELGAVCVAGNHDLIAVDRLDAAGIGALARTTLTWTRKVLDPDVRRQLAGLPLTVAPEPRIVLTHGSLHDPRRYIRHDAEAAEQLGRLAESYEEARLLLLGHTHIRKVYAERRGAIAGWRRALALPRDERVLLNPGSVGQSREASPHGRVLVLDTDAWEARFHAVHYDRRACRRALRERGLPERTYHRNPLAPRPLMRRAGLRARAAVRRAGLPV